MIRKFIMVLMLSLGATLGNNLAVQTDQAIIQKAEQGDAVTQFNLSVMYENDQGVRQNYVQNTADFFSPAFFGLQPVSPLPLSR
ncbi:hypothetical protein KU392_04460 [Advenella alkanexedens]|uniref:Uncharacterized protein n=1 Tax=Advenella alkanexedens TaxID=1481665 RepID=A0ABS6NMM7_9BURK|nr:hypothetical protein [Advenella alkanexedens]MBV4396512.1 hypothetical protein [Advenella alkanexedens]